MIIAVSNRVLVEQAVDDQAKKSGLVIPDESRHTMKIAKGVVLSVGANINIGAYTDTLVGMTVYFNKFAGDRITDENGEEFLVLKDSDILAIDQK